jgi:hypothetical protein
MRVLDWVAGATPKPLARSVDGANTRSVYRSSSIEAVERALHFPDGLSMCQPRAFTRAEGGMTMLDVLYIGLALGFLALSWGLVELCDRL